MATSNFISVFARNIKSFYYRYIVNYTSKKTRKKIGILLFGFFVLLVLFFFVKAPFDFPVGRIVKIEKGLVLDEITSVLKERNVIQIPAIFEWSIRLGFGETSARSGDYIFDKKLSVFSIVGRIARGEFGLDPVKITLHEGDTIFEMARKLSDKFSEFDSVNFLRLTRDMEGYLFPDTYFFLPNIDEKQVIDELRRVFDLKTAEFKELEFENDLTFEEIIILASIIQGEAWREKDQKLISGVLHNRLKIGMALQVDATFKYINGKNTYQLTYDDLEIDSKYNTYKYPGLPIGPIGNPGLSAIESAIYPEENNYLFYLADKEGNTYYSETHDEHLIKKVRYIR